jgi:hypothetical protein
MDKAKDEWLPWSRDILVGNGTKEKEVTKKQKASPVSGEKQLGAPPTLALMFLFLT